MLRAAVIVLLIALFPSHARAEARIAPSGWVKLCVNARNKEEVSRLPAIVSAGIGHAPALPKKKGEDVNICLTSHERIGGATGRVLVSAAVRQIEGQKKHHFMVMVPLGMLQERGIRVEIYSKNSWEKAQKNERIDEPKARQFSLSYPFCHPAGCTAETEASPKLLGDLKRSGGFVVLAINSSGQAVSFPVPLSGFEKAYLGKPADNKQYTEVRRALMRILMPTRCGVEVTVGQNELRCLRPGAGKTEYFKDCPTCPEMVIVPAGNFTMCSFAGEPSEVEVRVSIAAPFAVGRFAVTFDEWDACVADGDCNGYRPTDAEWGRGKHPVINVSWDDAKAYTGWLSHKTGKDYRLLSEAEREYVTRAGRTTPFWWGSSITPKQANYDGNDDPFKGGGDYRGRTVPVDSLEPNPWGLYNVHGNVWEWTEDCWNERSAGGPRRVLGR
jgi:formylglycine-generating enzyme required for sulfatase activity